MATVLLIDDDPTLLDSLTLLLEDEGHLVLSAPDGLRGWRLLQGETPDVVVSDVNMPGLDGFSLCRKAREAGFQVPILLLTARDSEIDEALGLELGADDYVSKPFSSRVLLARIRAVLRREAVKAATEESTEPLITSGALTMDRARLEICYHGKAISSTVSEFRLLEALVTREGIVLSRQRLLQLTRDDDSVVVERIVDTYVRRLRRKLESIEPGFQGIETVIGAGYRWRGA